MKIFNLKKGSHSKKINNRQDPYFYLLCIAHIGSVLTGLTVTSRIISVNIFHSFYITGGIFFIPICFFIQDIVTEIYGYYNARKMLCTTLIAFSLFVLAYYLVSLIPCNHSDSGCVSFSIAAKTLPRQALSFIISLAVGGTINNYILTKLKLAFDSKFLAARFISSTAIGEAFFQCVAVLIAWSGSYPVEKIILIAVAAYIYKILFEILSTPFNVYFCRYLKSIN